MTISMRLLQSFFIFLFLCSSACTNDQALEPDLLCNQSLEGWTIASYETSDFPKMNDLFFYSEQLGYSVGNAGTIIRTRNGGQDWSRIGITVLSQLPYEYVSQTNARLFATFFVNESIGYIGGGSEYSYDRDEDSDAVFLKTYNEGVSWEKNFIEGVVEIRDLFFFDEINGLGLFAVRNSFNNLENIPFETSNGGEDWQPLPLNATKLRSQFIKAGNQLMMMSKSSMTDSTLFVLDSQGKAWSQKQLPANHCNRLYFINEQVGYGTFGLLFFKEKVFKTVDGGDSWVEVESPMSVHSLVHFNDINEGFVINPIVEYVHLNQGSHYNIPAYEFSQTKDGGNAWQSHEMDKTCNFIDISYAPSKQLLYSLSSRGLNRFEVN